MGVSRDKLGARLINVQEMHLLGINGESWGIQYESSELVFDLYSVDHPAY
jgi:hypothetical protein